MKFIDNDGKEHILPKIDIDYRFGSPMKVGDVEFECSIKDNPKLKTGMNFWLTGEYYNESGKIERVEITKNETYKVNGGIYI